LLGVGFGAVAWRVAALGLFGGIFIAAGRPSLQPDKFTRLSWHRRAGARLFRRSKAEHYMFKLRCLDRGFIWGMGLCWIRKFLMFSAKLDP
jgi:hypothetical protein